MFLPEMTHATFQYPNGYGATIFRERNRMQWTITALKFDKYGPSVFRDAVDRLSEEEVEKELEVLRALPPV